MKNRASTDILVKIYEKSRTRSSPSWIAREMGWHVKGSTFMVGTLLRNILLYLCPETFEKIRPKKRAYVEAKIIIHNKYPETKKLQLELRLSHVEEMKPVEVWGSEYFLYQEEKEYIPTPAEKLDIAFKELRRSIKEFINSERGNGEQQPRLPVAGAKIASQPKNPPVPSNTMPLPEINDAGVQGYLLDDIKILLGNDFSSFIKWHKGRETGFLQGKVYILANDLETYLANR